MARFFIALAAACAIAVPLGAQTPATPRAAAASAPARISIPFNPPLDRPLRYRVTSTKIRNDAPVTIWIDYELRFSHGPEGYRLAVRTLDAGMPGASAAELAVVRRTLTGVAPPYVLLLDGTGTISAMEDADAYWERVVALTAQLIRSDPHNHGETDEAALTLIIDQLRETSPAARLAMTTENIAPILQFGGSDYAIGEQREGTERIDGPMGLVFQQQNRLRAERVADGRLFVSMHSSVPEESMRQAFESFSAHIPVTGQGHNNRGERDRAAAQIRTAHFNRQSDVVFEVALENGLVHRMDATDRTDFEMGEQHGTRTETQLIERMD